MRETLRDRRPRVTITLIFVLCAFVTYHSFNDYLTTKDVAHNSDVARATCRATDALTSAIRTVLMDSIKSSRRAETVLPQFRAEYQEQIRSSRRYLDRLFVIQHC